VFAAVPTAVSAFEVIPGCEDEIAILVYVVVNAFYRFAAFVKLFGDIVYGGFRGYRLNIFRYLFPNDNFETIWTAAILTKIERHYRRVIIAPAILARVIRTAAKIYATD